MLDSLIERLVDLVDPAVNRIHNMSVGEARADPARLGERYVALLAEEIAKWLRSLPES